MKKKELLARIEALEKEISLLRGQPITQAIGTFIPISTRCMLCSGGGCWSCTPITSGADWTWRPEQGAQWISPQAGISSDGRVTNGPLATIKD